METKRPDAIVTDLDGTLLGPDKQVGERDAAAIRRLTRLGIPVVPGTGRPIFGIGPLMEELGLELALCSNGGSCYDFGRRELVFAQTIPEGTLRRLVDWMLEKGVRCMLHTPFGIYCSQGVKPFAHYILEEGQVGAITPGMSLAGVEVLKVLIFDCDENEMIRELRAVFPEEELAICSSGIRLVDINPPGVGKGDGVRRLAECKGWRTENILAMGDNYNDRTMLETVGMGVVPGNGEAEIRPLAKYVTTPNGENPLSAAIDHFFPGLLEGI
ncbi:MAG: HAD family phosphatase [Angelakisella sp.]|jgi:Cof subfamily protein (haloacid dehalogenase superfamily)|nr:HAD family phosphatase [Angelakisella sp.]MCI9529279.1 HAD family phosphatase [Angelakisella sp.]